MNVIPITILTGFLGSGKTTLLNRILSAEHGLKVAVLVNDFGSVNVDAQLVVGVEGEMITLSNGCICCTIRGDLVTAIYDLLQHESPPEYIIIEASGISDPAQVVLTFNRSVLRNYTQIDSIVSVLDAEHFFTLDDKEKRLVREQTRIADIVIVNKVDLVDSVRLKQVHEWVQQQVSGARILDAVECDVPLEFVLGIGTYNPQRAFDKSGHGAHIHSVEEEHDHEHHDHSLVYSAWTWVCDEPLSISHLRQALENVPPSVYRAKGIVYVREVPDKRIVLQMVGKRAALTEGKPWDDAPPVTQLVFVGEKGGIDVDTLTVQLEACRASLVPQNEVSQLVDGVLKWLRLKPS